MSVNSNPVASRLNMKKLFVLKIFPLNFLKLEKARIGFTQGPGGNGFLKIPEVENLVSGSLKKGPLFL